jgi:glycosyltransferase involved in cell wall biosynthesis
MSMRILHVITTIDRGGAENHLADLAISQMGRDEVAVAYLKGNGYWALRLQNAGVGVEPLGMARYGDPRPLFALRRLIRKWAPDIVHAHMPPAELYARLALTGIDARVVPLIISKHNDEPFYRGPGSSRVARWAVARSAHVIAISDAVKRFMLSHHLVDSPNRIVSIHYGIDPRPFDEVTEAEAHSIREDWGIGQDTYVVGTVARLVPQKSLETLLEGFAAFRRNASEPARLVMVGRGPLEAPLRALAESLGIANDVVWAGFREDIPSVMKAFDLFALTSRYEGFGLVLLEAMAAQRPVIATRVSAIPEVVNDGETGKLIEPGCADELAEAIRYFREEEVRVRFGLAGRTRVAVHFTSQRVQEQVSGLYQACRARSAALEPA